ncbi:MAG: SRPBCC domain-containing protein [Gemmatimonadota bacterium]|nr:SRPBCC domain-containing protein [Gemmatimonadota bacterium]
MDVSSGASSVAVHGAARFDAPAEVVFDAWLNPLRVGAFFFGHPAGRMIRAELDPHAGGSYRFVDRRGGEDVEHFGRNGSSLLQLTQANVHPAYAEASEAAWEFVFERLAESLPTPDP